MANTTPAVDPLAKAKAKCRALLDALGEIAEIVEMPGDEPVTVDAVLAAVRATVESRNQLVKELAAATQPKQPESLPIDSPHLSDAIEKRFKGLGKVKAHFPAYIQLSRGIQFVGECGHKYVVLGFASWKPSFGVVCAKVSTVQNLPGPDAVLKGPVVVTNYRTSWVLHQLDLLEPFRKHNLLGAAGRMGIDPFAVQDGITMEVCGQTRVVRVVDVVKAERKLPIRVQDTKTGAMFKINTQALQRAQELHVGARKRPAPESDLPASKKQAP